MKRFINGGLFLFFFLMLVLPASFQIQRGVILLGLLIFSLRGNALKKFRIYKPILYITLINVLFSFLFFVNGYINNNPGATVVTTVFIFWPILYLYFIGFNTKISQLFPLLKTIFYGGIASACFIMVMIFWMLGFVPLNLTFLAKAQDFSVYWDNGSSEINSVNLATVMYVLIFSISYLMFPKSYIYKNIISKKIVVFTAIVSFIIILLSARRAVWLAVAISPIIIYIIYRLSNIKLKITRYVLPGIALTFVVTLSAILFSMDSESFVNEFFSSFEFDNPASESNYLRLEQYNALIDGWKQSPVIGAGLGAAASGSVRDVLAPWAYELSYLALLFHTGIIGLLIYSLSVLWIVYKSVRLSRINKLNAIMLLPQITSLIAFLLINASNPYLGKFDYLWTIFLPVTTINAIMISSKESLENVNNA